MPDYGTTSGSGTGASDKSYTKGSGYTASPGGAEKKKTSAQKRREKLQKQLDAQKAAYEKQLAIDAAKARETFTKKPTTSTISNQEQQRLAAEAAKARQALQDLGGMTGNVPVSSINKSSASRPSTAYDSSSQQTSKIITGEHSNKTAFEKMRDDFLMDIGAKEKDADYYYRLSDRTKAAQDRAKDATKITTTGSDERTKTIPPQRDPEIDPFRPPPDLPPEIVDPFRPPVMPPQFPQYPGMYGGIGAFGYSPALMQFESQQGAGQVPYYMAAARNAQTPNMSPAFMHAARNYDILGGMQRTAPRPIEMMSAAERAQIAGMGSNFNTPNYNSPYDQFNFFSNMVSGGMPTQVPTGSSGKGARPSGVGLGALLASGMFG